jgi:hypothetical protein
MPESSPFLVQLLIYVSSADSGYSLYLTGDISTHGRRELNIETRRGRCLTIYYGNNVYRWAHGVSWTLPIRVCAVQVDVRVVCVSRLSAPTIFG